MIPNCRGCKVDLEEVEFYSDMGLHFAGEGLYEKGHLLIRMVNNNGKVIVE